MVKFFLMKDLMGKAIWDYFHNNHPEDILTETSVSEQDILPVDYLFRTFAQMPPVEQKAMELAHGKVLDVGAAAGAHSIYLQNEKKLDVTALDFSPLSIEVCRARGIKKAICCHLLDFDQGTYDSILMMMNGTGIFENISKADVYLQKLKSLLNPGGQILIDSTDIIYMYGNEDGVIMPKYQYYGEIQYYVTYKGEKEDPFTMLYMDIDTLKKSALKNGFQVKKILKDDYAFLARLTLNDEITA